MKGIYKMKENNAALKITIIYIIVSILWIFISDNVLLFLNNNIKIIVGISSIKGYIFIFITSIMLYLFIERNLSKQKQNEKNLRNSYEELTAVYEELYATEESLRSQYDELQFREKEIEHMAYYDSLTELPNRLLFVEKLGLELEKAKEYNIQGVVLFLDLDDFKRINDTLGHNYGDKLLKAVSTKLKLCTREKDIVARFSGDEFLILIPEVYNHIEIANIARRILKIFDSKFELEEKQIFITASIGIIVYPIDGDDVNVIIRNADTAMYKAKSLGKNRYCFFDKNLSEDVYRKSEVEKGLRNALEKEELEVYYQPQVNVQTNRIIGFEALLRWNNKELGNVSPYEFIPIAEETGIINSIFKWLLRKICMQNIEWKNKGYDFQYISINVSSIQFKYENFIRIVKNILNETDVKPECIQIEITESVLMQSINNALNLLSKLKDIGIKIALDDFGTGYSSLNYLRLLPIDTLKIDKSFIDDITNNLEAKDITDGIIQLAHKIKLEVVAEGVEDIEQLELLKQMNCNIIQGYYYCKPLPINELDKVLQNGNFIKCDGGN